MKAIRFAASFLIVAAILALYHLWLGGNNTTVALTLLLAILGVSARWGLAEATAASLAAVLGFNFFFLPPFGTLTIQDPQNWVALAAFLVTAVTASQLSARVRRRAADAEARRLEIERLYVLVQAMILSGNPRKTIREFVNRVVQVFGCGAAAFYYGPADEVFRTGPESDLVSDHGLRAAAENEDLSIDATRPGAIEPRPSALLYSLAHDIKTPLPSIKAAVTALLGASAPADLELLTIIDEEADRLNHL